MRKLASFITITAAIGFASTAAHAGVSGVPLVGTYTWEGVGSGTIGSSSFTDAAFTITSVGLESQLTPYINIDDVTIAYAVRSDTMITIEGLGSFEFSQQMNTYVDLVNQSMELHRFGFGGIYEMINLTNPVFDGWNLFTDIAPVSGTGFLDNWAVSPSIETEGGTLVFNTDTNAPLTFSAVVVPAPSPIAIASAMGLLAARRRRRSDQA